MIAVADSATTPVGMPVTINVLANDTGGVKPLSVSAVNPPSNGAATISGTAILYTPKANFSGTDSFTYTAEDAGTPRQTSSATVTVIVTASKLVAVADSATTPSSTSTRQSREVTGAELTSLAPGRPESLSRVPRGRGCGR